MKKCKTYFKYESPKQTAWDKLSMEDRADMIKVCVRHGITDLQDVRTAYNNYKGGRDIFEGISDYNQKASEFGSFLTTGGHIYDGTQEKSQQMKTGRSFWQFQTQAPFFNMDFPVNGGTLPEVVVTGRKNRQKEVMRQRLAEMQEVLKDYQNDYLTASNDNTWVESRDPRVQRRKNPHLATRAIEGAKAHAAWEKEHPILTAWGNILGAAPFAVAAYPFAATVGSGVAALGDAAAATTVGQGITDFLAPVATSTIAGATLPQWANVGLTSAFGAHGVQTAIDEGGVSPTTALEIAPMLQVAKPMVNEAALAIENYRYPLGRPQVPDGFGSTSTFTFGDLGDKAGYYTHIGLKPKSQVWISKDKAWPELADLGENSRGVSLYQIDSKAFNTKFGEPTLVDFEGNSLGVPISKGNWEEPSSIFKGFPQAVISREQMMQVPHIKTTRNPMTGMWERSLYQPKNKVSERVPSLTWGKGRTIMQYNDTGSPYQNLGSFTWNRTGNVGDPSITVKSKLFGDFVGEGSEQTVFGSLRNSGEVLKVNTDKGFSSIDGIRDFHRKSTWMKRNQVPYQERMSISGFLTNPESNTIYPVYGQGRMSPFVSPLQGRISSVQKQEWENVLIPQIDAKFHSKGYIGSVQDGLFTGPLTVGDISPWNIGFNRNGQLRFIDFDVQ